jgi:hypothetical protein
MINYTSEDFKTLFFRGFNGTPFLPLWDDEKAYKVDDIVFYGTDSNFYKCISDNVDEVPTDTDFWESYTDSIYNYILDADIENAMNEAKVNFNEGLWTEDSKKISFLYLTAHYLCLDLRRVNAGIQSTGENLVKSRTIGSVSESYEIPKYYTENPAYAYYVKTEYGLKYLSLLIPRTMGCMFVIEGDSIA